MTAEKTDPADEPTVLIKLAPSQDWLATFWCVNCETHHQLLLLKQRKNYKAFLIENDGAKTKSKFFGDYKNLGGAPDDKVLDDLADNFGPEDEEDDEEEEEEEEA